MSAHDPHGADRWHMEAEERRRQGFVAVLAVAAAVLSVILVIAEVWRWMR